MPTHLAAFMRKDAFRLPTNRVSHISADCRGLAWPVNEIVLASLVLRGKSAGQIATELGVSVEQVNGLREDYDV